MEPCDVYFGGEWIAVEAAWVGTSYGIKEADDSLELQNLLDEADPGWAELQPLDDNGPHLHLRTRAILGVRDHPDDP